VGGLWEIWELSGGERGFGVGSGRSGAQWGGSLWGVLWVFDSGLGGVGAQVGLGGLPACAGGSGIGWVLFGVEGRFGLVGGAIGREEGSGAEEEGGGRSRGMNGCCATVYGVCVVGFLVSKGVGILGGARDEGGDHAWFGMGKVGCEEGLGGVMGFVWGGFYWGFRVWWGWGVLFLSVLFGALGSGAGGVVWRWFGSYVGKY